MSVLDIIYITPKEFRLQQEHAVQCEKIKETYTKLLSQYDCFTKPDLVLLKFPTTIKTQNQRNNNFSHGNEKPKQDRKAGYSSFKTGYGRQQQQGQNHTNHAVVYSKHRPQLKAFAITQGDPVAETMRHLKGLLNIINKKNYNKVLQKVLSLVTATNIECIVDTILDTACCQVFYVGIFYKLLIDVIAHMDETLAPLTQTRINYYIETFIAEAEFMYFPVESKESDYMKFCLLQKHKCLATSRSLVILELLINKHSNIWNEQSYLDYLVQYFATIIAESVEIVTELEQNIDTILCMVRDIKKRCKSVLIKNDLCATISNNGIGSKRMQFMVQDIMKK